MNNCSESESRPTNAEVLLQHSRRLHRHRDKLLFLIFGLLSVGVFFIPTGFEEKVERRAVRCRGEVLHVDNTHVYQQGMVKQGDQTLELKLMDGPFKGRVVQANNPLLGQMDRDELFRPGETAFVVLTLDGEGNIQFVHPQGHYRLGWELFLLVAFGILLLAFGHWTGAKALLSFVFAGLVMWKILIPGLLRGWDPILLTLAVVGLLSAAIIFLVAGLSRRGLVAFLGAFLGLLTSCALAMFFTDRLHVNGATLPFSSTLLYSGYGHLNLARIFIAAVFLAASGAVMDLAVDVSASMHEVVRTHPGIGRLELMKSGINVGRAVVGTMTTTLLFAYSGGYVTLLMSFMARGVPVENTLNVVYVAPEILRILVGSFGLVTVAPFTALVGGLVMARAGEKG
jgi:uncharacterized membrane protein